ncbi:MAG: DNA helicase UvrD [Thermodesulfobacterium geofontis]|uniref:DNA helicase UvrD n=1 Tax=Thermodesulfobacterium geofontis TaxID=1295609 RepID=A0A2N7Q796_9BACT|nr:MAG: DNA helicase UvrD [Thermodesulfobacterium geofontis]PMP94014.1 MAG: DNA helicase UvrD [Thermodesulfobacterium geofontis]
MEKNKKFPSKELLEKTFLADLHIHSKYSRACSKFMEIPFLAETGKIKGLQVIGTGDFTHPMWLKELKEYLEYDIYSGLYVYNKLPEGPKFILTSEISLIFSKNNKSNRRVHLIIIAPDFKTVEEINLYLSKLGNLLIDGRPTFGIDCEKLTLDLLKISEKILIIPAHAWTPWYSVFGAFSGFDSLEEAFGEATPYIYAIETGLSSDPEMNWRISKLDNITLISCSDAHSLSKLGREATAFFYPLTYENIYNSIKTGNIAFTIEFYPEEGKYHYDGHRNCKVCLSPKETKALGYKCPKCGNPLTVGVLHRVELLADRDEGYIPSNKPLSVHLVPFIEIITEVFNLNKQSKSAEKLYEQYLSFAGTEFEILLKLDLKDLEKVFPSKLIEAIKRVREGKIFAKPGYDGEYGIIRIFESPEEEGLIGLKQQSLFTLQ